MVLLPSGSFLLPRTAAPLPPLHGISHLTLNKAFMQKVHFRNYCGAVQQWNRCQTRLPMLHEPDVWFPAAMSPNPQDWLQRYLVDSPWRGQRHTFSVLMTAGFNWVSAAEKPEVTLTRYKQIWDAGMIVFHGSWMSTPHPGWVSALCSTMYFVVGFFCGFVLGFLLLFCLLGFVCVFGFVWVFICIYICLCVLFGSFWEKFWHYKINGLLSHTS